MKTQHQTGDFLDLTAVATAFVSGKGRMVGGLFAIPVTNAAIGEKAACATEGVHVLAKEATTAVFTEGEIVYWDPAADHADETGATHFPIGTAVEAAGATAATVKVKLFGYAVAVVGQ